MTAMRRALVFAIVMTMTALFSAVPAQASTVNVTLRLSVAEPIASPQVKSCSVTVDAGADGLDVLEAAKDAYCILSYKAQPTSLGNFVDCINEICSAVVTYWRMTENGAMTSYGVDDFSAAEGDVLGFSYTTWLTCETDYGC